MEKPDIYYDYMARWRHVPWWKEFWNWWRNKKRADSVSSGWLSRQLRSEHLYEPSERSPDRGREKSQGQDRVIQGRSSILSDGKGEIDLTGQGGKLHS